MDEEIVSNGQNEDKYEEESSEEEFEPASNGNNDPQSSINNSTAQDNAHSVCNGNDTAKQNGQEELEKLALEGHALSSLLEMYPNINAAFLNSKFVEFNGNLEKVTDYIKLHNFSQVLYGQKEHKYEKENSEEEFEPAPDESYLNSSLQQDLLSFGEKSIVKKTNGKNGDPMDANNDQWPLEKGPGGKKDFLKKAKGKKGRPMADDNDPQPLSCNGTAHQNDQGKPAKKAKLEKGHPKAANKDPLPSNGYEDDDKESEPPRPTSLDPSWLTNVAVTPQLTLTYQIKLKNSTEVLKQDHDYLKKVTQPKQAIDPILAQLKRELEKTGKAIKPLLDTNLTAQNGEESAGDQKRKNEGEKDSVSKKAIVEIEEGQRTAKKTKLAAATVAKLVFKEDSEISCKCYKCDFDASSILELTRHYTLVHEKNGAEANGSGSGSAQNGEGSAGKRKRKYKNKKDSVSEKAKLDEDDDGIVCLDDNIVEFEEGQSPAKKAKLAAAAGGTTVAKPVTKEDSELLCMDWSYLETLGAKRRVGPPRVCTTSCTSSNSAGEESKDTYINNSVPEIMDEGTSVHGKKSLKTRMKK